MAKEDNTPVDQKSWYLVQVHGIAPVYAEYRIFAKDEEEALEIVESNRFKINLNGPPKPDMLHFKKKMVKIKDLFTGMINFMRNF